MRPLEWALIQGLESSEDIWKQDTGGVCTGSTHVKTQEEGPWRPREEALKGPLNTKGRSFKLKPISEKLIWDQE